ncbi:MAG: hypothetical protein L3J74_02090 [Bacteroidales bacterium]|nr:hypothetical protein [Bacteroidales bacterium]
MKMLYRNYFYRLNLTLLILLFSFSIYSANITSTASGGNWSSTSTWVGGVVPGAADDVTIAAGATVILDQDVTILSLTVNGSFVIGNDATARNLTITGATTIASGASFTVGNFDITHIIVFQAAVTNDGTLDLYNTSSQVANVTFDATNGDFTVGGANTPQFNSVIFTGGTITAGVAFDINGAVVIEDATTFADGNFIHTVAGNWTENGTGQRTGNGTIQMDATLIQSITTAATFYNLTFNGGGIGVIAANITVTNNFLISNNTEVQSSANNIFQANFTVDNGSKYTAVTGRATFNSASDQTITIGTTSGEDNVVFYQAYFQTGGTKTINGNMTVNNVFSLDNGVIIADNSNTQTFSGNGYFNGTCNFSGTIIFKGGTQYDTVDDDFTLGTANIIIKGYTYIAGGDIMRVNGDMTVNLNDAGNHIGFIVNDAAQLIGSTGKTLTISSNTSLYIRGANNFPTGFGTINLEQGSYVRYDANLNDQTINNSVAYWHLYLNQGTSKTAAGNLDVNGNLYIYNGTEFRLGNYDMSLAGDIRNTDDTWGNGSLTATGGTVTLDAADGNQYIYIAGTGSYTFNNLILTNTAPTTVRGKYFRNDITVNGNLYINNLGGSSTNILIVDIDDHNITGGIDLSLGANVELRTSGINTFGSILGSFSGTKTFDVNSTVRFDKTDGDQQIPDGITYGNISLYGSNAKTPQGNLDINGSVSAVGGTPVLTDNLYQINVAGDWNMSLATTNLTGDSYLVFDGTDQDISQSNFSNVYFINAGTKNISGQLNILNNLVIQNDAIVQTDQYIYISGNWSEAGNAQFRQTAGRVTFNGSTANQTISMNSGSYFYNFTIDKSGSNKTVTANSDIDINGTFNFVENNAVFDLNGNNLYVARDFYFRDGCTFIHNLGKVYFDGNDYAQSIRNYNSNTIVFNDVEFSGTAVKSLYNNSFRFQGNVLINNTTLDGQNYPHYVEGDWTNTGIFRHSNTLYFNGAKDQNISGSSFHSVRFGGGNYTKTLFGDITLTGNLWIDDATLDVSANNYNITLDDYWHNDSTGSFIAHQGTVTVTGEYNRIFTGVTNTAYNGGQVVTQGGTKDFYNLIINASSEDYWMFIHGNLIVKNNFEIIKGRFYQSYDPNNYGINDIYVSGDFINHGSIYNNNYGEKFILNPTTGNHMFDPGSTNTYGIIEFNGASGTSYTFNSDLILYANRTLTIFDGIIDLNSNKITTNSSGGNITINGGTLEVDSAATISMGNGATFTNAGGNFILAGHPDNPASLIASSGNYTFIQTSGTISASNFHIEGTSGNGIEIQGGTIDNANAFQNGSFSSGTGTAYLTVSGIDLGGDIDINDVSFNSGPTYNVQRTSGNGAMNFINTTGALAGEAYENDNGTPGTLINWSYPGAAYWDGNSDGDGDNIHWNDPNNWVSGTVPTSTSQVILDHSNVSGTYTVEISTADAVAKSIFINSGSNQISLVLNGYELSVENDITIGSTSVLTQTNATDSIKLGGSWSNEGTFNEGTATVVFNTATGTHSINTQGAGDAFYNLVIDGTGGNIVIGSTLDINGNMELKGGTLTAGANTITIAGNWSRTGGAVFNVGTSTVNFDGTDQNINGGEFYNLITSNSGTKTITANIDINRDITIGAGTILDGGANTIYVGDDWTNEVGNSGFVQTGAGTVIFDGESVDQDIGSSSTQVTTFNNVIITGTRTKYTRQNMTINGDLIINSAALYIVDGTSIDGAGANNSLNMSNGRIYVNGTNNFPQNFENINLSGGTVDYYANIDQTVFPTTYNTLMLRHISGSGAANTKNLSGDIDVKANLYIYDDETELNVNGYTIQLQGNLDKRGSSTPIVWGTTGTLIHYGANWTLDADINSLNNVIKKNSGYLRIIYHSIDITGDMSILEDAYLQQDTVNITCTGTGKTFTLAATAYVNSYNPSSLGSSTGRKAFPVGFTNYNLHKESRVYIRGNIGDQTIYTVPNYGNLYIYTNAQINVELDGNLDVEGDFRMFYDTPTLIDNGYNINIAGDYVDIRTYSPSSGSILTFDGVDQRILDAGAGATVFDMTNVVFAGSGQKSLYNGGDDYYSITGDLTINDNVTVYIPRRLDFSGANWTNNGTFNHTAYVVNFTGASLQTIDPGADNNFYAVSFSGNGQKDFVNNGINVNNGTFTLENGSSVNMNNLTHFIASERITNNGGTWTTNNASFVWDRNGTQYIPSMTCQDMTFRRYDQWTRIRYLEGNISIDDLTIEEGTQLRCSANAETTTPAYDVTMTGNFINNGAIYAYGNNFNFESNNSDTKVIKQGVGYFDNVSFNQKISGQSTRAYTLTEETRFYEDLVIGSGATLDLNGQILRLGNDDPNDPVEPQAEEHIIQNGGTLDVDAGASLLFSCRDVGNPKLDVQSGGTLKIVGTNGNNATISSSDWYSNTHRIDINVLSGATVHARYYIMKYLTDEGFEVADGATIDASNNFSDGTWSELNTSASGTHYYWYCNADVSGIGTVDNLTFNFNGTPTVGAHFNIKRDATSTGVLSLGGTASGLLAGSTYEADDTGENNSSSSLIDWPPVSEVYWTGALSSDWFTAGNWSPAQVPDANTNAVIPSQSNNPIITGQNADCKDLKILDGFLTLQAGYDLTVSGDVYLGSGTNVGILAVDNAACTINVSGSWTRAQNAIFVQGNGTVNFNATGGTVSIDPRNSAFGNLNINGGASFLITRAEIFIDNNLTIASGALVPNVNNYSIHIKGNYDNVGGTFDNSVTGTVLFDGDNNQTITNGEFTNVTIDGSGTKTTANLCIINGNLQIKNGTFAGGDIIDMNGYVTIDASGSFDDGGFTHTFGGIRWTSTGSYSGVGTIDFDRGGTQYINGGTFNNLVFKNSGAVILENDIDIVGNLSLIDPNTYFNVQTYQVTNTSGTGTFSMADSRRIYVRGANNFPIGFANYSLHENSSTYYDGTIQQTIASVPVVYGNLFINNSTKILAGPLDINGFLYFYDDAVLDVTANNYRINIEGNWNNTAGATFIPHEGEVVFDGNDAYTYLRIYDESKDTNPFYKLTINKGAGELRSYWTDITIQNNLRVLNGILYQNQTMYVSGDMSAISGTFGAAGTYYLNKPSGTSNLQLNGSVINNLIINSGATYYLQDDLLMNGQFNLIAGTFDGNGNMVRMGNYGEVNEISGLYKIGSGGILQLPNYGTLKVNSGGEIWVVGEENNVATVTNYGGRYYFNVESGATIRAKYYLFEYMAENGIYIKDGAIINANYNFSYGTFTNAANGGTCLRIENTQEFSESNGNPIVQVSFPLNPNGGASNVTKTNTVSGILDFKDYSGEFAGEDFDNDPNNLINWISPPTIVWTGNIDNDWYKTGNWQVSSGPDRIPLISDNVIIPQKTNQPVIDIDGAEAKTVEVQENATLTLSSSAATDTTLKVAEDINIAGRVVMTSGNDTLAVGGNWTNTGMFTAGTGTVIMNSQSGIKIIDNLNDYFYNLHINTANNIQLSRNLVVNNNFKIINGSFDLAANNRILTVKGDFDNKDVFISQNGKLIFAGSNSQQNFNPGNSTYYNIDISVGSGTTVLLNGVLNVLHNMNINSGTFDLNNSTFNFGDGTGTDVLTIAGGTLNVDENAYLKPANTASVEVNSGGVIKFVGTDIDNPAYLQSQSGYYSFSVNSGATIHAKFYNFEHMNANGIRLQAGATIDATDNFSDGVWRNGVNPGQYLWLENDFTDFTVTGVYFHNSASVNVKRLSGSGIITFEDALGLLAGAAYEDDNPANGETTGNIHWTYTHTVCIWTGNIDTDWNKTGNWDNNQVPDANSIARIPDVSAGSSNFPVIGINAASIDAVCYDLIIEQGASLSFDNGKNLDVDNTVNIATNALLKVNAGSNSQINVGDIWSVDGVFEHGNSATVVFDAPAGKLLTISGNSRFYNLEINSTGNAEYLTGNPLIIDGSFTITSGQFTISDPNDTLYVGGNFSNSGNFIHGNGVVYFNGANQDIANTGSGNFYNITFAGSQTKSLTSDITVENDLNISTGATLNGASYNIKLYGDWVDKGTFSPGTSTVSLLGSNTQVVDNYNTETFYNFTVNNSAPTFPQIILYGNLDLSGDNWTLTDGVIESSNNEMLSVGQNVVLSGGDNQQSYVTGPLTRTGSTDFVFPLGDGTKFARLGVSGLTANATFVAQYHNAAYTDATTVGAGIDHISNYEYWDFNRTSGSENPIVTLYWEDGTESEIDNLTTLTVVQYISGQWEDLNNGGTTGTIALGTISSGTSLTSFGPLTFGSTNGDNPLHSYSKWNGNVSTVWNDAANWTGGIPDATKNAIIPAAPSNQPVIDINAQVKQLTIEENASLNINPLKSLTTNGRITINGTLRLNSDANGNASFINNDVISYGVNANVYTELYLTGWKYHYVSSPTVAAPADIFKSVASAPQYNHNFYWYDETDENADWSATAWHEENGNMGIMTGYATYFDRNPTVIFDRSTCGDFNTGDKSKSLTYTGSSAAEVLKRGWNLVGNPFPAYIDWDAAGWVKTNIYNSVYFWNGTNYSYYVPAGDPDGAHDGGAGTNDATGIIPPMQGFFVKVKEGIPDTDNQTGILTIPETARTTATHAFWKKANKTEPINSIRLIASGNGYTDETLLRIVNSASYEFDDNYDAFKLISTTSGIPQVYTIGTDTIECAISSVPDFYDELIIPVGFSANQAGSYTFTVNNFVLSDGRDAFFEDKYTNETMGLNNLNYTFSTETGKFEDRFVIKFTQEVTAIDDLNKIENANIKIYSKNGNIYLKTDVPKAILGELKVFDVKGNIVLITKNNTEGFAEIPLNVVNGVYVVVLNNDKRQVKQRVVIFNP